MGSDMPDISDILNTSLSITWLKFQLPCHIISEQLQVIQTPSLAL
jgi:hypothetical protein